MSGGPVFTAPFSAVTLTTNPYDLFHITAPTNSRVVIREIRLGQYTEFGDAQAELLSLALIVGTTSPSTASALLTQNVQRHAGAPTAATVVAGPSTAISSTASGALILADAWNVEAGWWWSPEECQRVTLRRGQRAVISMGAPNDAMTLNGVVVFQEIGTPGA